jgi:hypothetical protein
MKRGELMFTIAGLVATFALPWPCSEQRAGLLPAGPTQPKLAVAAAGAQQQGRHIVFIPGRTGPFAGPQPTR